MSPSSSAQRQLAHPRVAELVADELRSRIVNGELQDGALLPKQDDLLIEFPVGRPSIREAMRILETEGLISVRRGNMGGAVVHAPSAAAASFSFGLVMQNLGVTVEDLAAAFRIIEPKCAALCASRADRATEVIPALRKINQEVVTANGPAEVMQSAVRFHAAIIYLCGNTTVRLIMQSLEALWLKQPLRPAELTYADRDPQETALKETIFQGHAQILDMIEKGDASGAEMLLLHHMEESQASTLETHGTATVTVTGRAADRWPPP